MTLDEKIRYAEARYGGALLVGEEVEANKWAKAIYELKEEKAKETR